MDDISYFDHQCIENYFNRKYLHYLHPRSLEIVLLCCRPKMSKRRILEEIKRTNPDYDFKIHWLETRIRQIRCNLRDLEKYADIFNVTNKITPMPLSDLNNIVYEYIKEVKEVKDE